MSETDAEFVDRMLDLHLKCVSPSFDDGNRLMTIARRCVDATEVTARLIAERDALTAEVARLKAVEADYDLHEREMIELEEDNGRLTAENEKLRAALDKICNGPRDADLDYVDLFVEVKIEARAAITPTPMEKT